VRNEGRCLNEKDFHCCFTKEPFNTLEICREAARTLGYETVTDMFCDLADKYKSARGVNKIVGLSSLTVGNYLTKLGFEKMPRGGANNLGGRNMYFKQISYNELCKRRELFEGVVENREFHGFIRDYRVLHYLLRLVEASRCFEIGTHLGTGTNIICNALNINGMHTGIRFDVYSLDLPIAEAGKSEQHIANFSPEKTTGQNCGFPYKQFLHDSLTFDYSLAAPFETWYIDGEHDYDHVYHETNEVLSFPSTFLAVFHDTDMPEVYRGIATKLKEHNKKPEVPKYYLFRVHDTRVSFLIREDYVHMIG
jgi:hypothetical protein